MKKIMGKKGIDYGDEMNSLLQQITSSVEHIRGNHLWFYFKSMIPKSEELSQKDSKNATNKEIISHIERGIDKITQKMDNVIRALDNSSEISDVKKHITNVEEMIPELKHWLEVGCSKPERDLKEQAERVLPPLEDLRVLLVKLSELEKKSKDRQRREKDTPKASLLLTDLEREKVKVEKLQNSLNKVGLTIDQAMDANNILDSMATSPRFLKAVRDRLAAREKCSNSSKKRITLDDLLSWTDMPSDNNIETKPYDELDTTLLASHESFLQALNTQLNVKYDTLAQRQKVLNNKLRMAQEEKRLLQFQLEKLESNISELKAKSADLMKDRKMLDDFRGLAETYKKQK